MTEIERATAPGGIAGLHAAFVRACEAIPLALVALLARLTIAAVFWRSGQTKVQGFALDVVDGRFALGWPRLGDFTVDLFRYEYQLPLIPPEVAAPLTAWAEHVFPALLVLGLATRASALALLVMTLVIQVFVYPSAWVTHGMWAAILLYLISRGPGALSLDHLLARRGVPT
jgi:putative oxidoreductase